MNLLIKWLGTRHPLALLTAGLLTGIFLLAVVLLIYFRKRQDNNLKELAALSAKLMKERTKSEAIFRELEIGLLAYGTDGRLSLSNEAALTLLGMPEPTKSFDDLLTAYGEENGIKARVLLGKGDASGILNRGKRVLRMSVRVSRAEDRRRIANVVILQDITDQELQEKQRKEFVANVSHELKTPLTTIATYSESLLDWGLEEKQREGVRKDVLRIHDDAIRMQNLVTDLLLLSSIDSQKMYNRMEPLNLEQLVRQTVERVQIHAQEKEIDLACISLAIVAPVFADRQSIERIVSNLLSNAIKYTERKGEVKVYIGKVNDLAYIKVTDNGPGIEEQYLDRIFNRFYRVDATGSRLYGGTGLGLAIVKELVDLHHGQIDVQSTLGQGSSFTVIIPFANKTFREVLIDVKTGTLTDDVLNRAAAGEILLQAQTEGINGSRLEDLSDAEFEHLMSHYQAGELANPDIIEESDIFTAIDPELDVQDESLPVRE